MRFRRLFQMPESAEKINVRKEDWSGIRLNGDWHALDAPVGTGRWEKRSRLLLETRHLSIAEVILIDSMMGSFGAGVS